MKTDPVRVAVIQAAPVFFDRDATVAKIAELTDEAAANNARLILFPEAFIPAYPRGLSFGAVVGSRTPAGRRLWARYWANSVPVPGPTTEALGEMARRARAYLAVGVIEQEGEFGRGTLYCTLLYFGPDGVLLGKHRKLMPTAAERVDLGSRRWQHADRARHRDRPHRRADLLGELHAAGTHGALRQGRANLPGAHRRCPRNVAGYAAPHRVRRALLRARLQPIRREKPLARVLEGMEELADAPEILCRGGSAIISPLGDVIAGPLYDREGILYADLDLTQVIEGKFDFDVVGHYARPDVFCLAVDERTQSPVVWTRTD